MKDKLIYKGKVRYVYSNKDDENQLYMVSTDRVSSFDRQICIMNGKGEMLTKMSEFWFNATKHIIPNHMISTNSNEILVKKCKPIPIEFVVRGYITGNTNTSLWSHYSRGERNYCGINFQDGLIKNQRLSEPVVTPTTKSDHDEPISKNDIIERGLLTDKECDYIYDISLKLYNYGVKLSRRVGFILVDTKYEFGKDYDGNIILIDEIHTCDSSRYWISSSYDDCFLRDIEPTKLDKDCIRDWVKEKCDPYKDIIPEVPQEIIQKAYESYKYFYNNIVKSIPIVSIIMGSDSDMSIMRDSANILEKLNIDYEMTIVSAHRTPHRLFEYSECVRKRGIKVIIAGAGGSAHLPGMVAALTPIPVIGVPIKLNTMDGMDSLLSIVQMPKGVPVATVAINGAYNAGILASRILGVSNDSVLNRVEDLMEESRDNVMKKIELIEEVISPEDYFRY